MSALLNLLGSMERRLGRFAATIGCLSFMISTPLGAWGLWETVRPRKPLVQFVVNSESNVVDVKRPTPELSIQFQGRELSAQNLNLRVIRMTISNTGDIDVSGTHYDSITQWGYAVDHGQLVESRLVSASSAYLQDAVGELRSLSDHSVALKPMQLDIGSSFTLDLLIIHDRDSLPSIRPTGKILGQASVPVITEQEFQYQKDYAYVWFGRFFLIVVAVVSSVPWIGLVLFMVRELLRYRKHTREVEQSRKLSLEERLRSENRTVRSNAEIEVVELRLQELQRRLEDVQPDQQDAEAIPNSHRPSDSEIEVKNSATPSSEM